MILLVSMHEGMLWSRSGTGSAADQGGAAEFMKISHGATPYHVLFLKKIGKYQLFFARHTRIGLYLCTSECMTNNYSNALCTTLDIHTKVCTVLPVHVRVLLYQIQVAG